MGWAKYQDRANFPLRFFIPRLDLIRRVPLAMAVTSASRPHPPIEFTLAVASPDAASVGLRLHIGVDRLLEELTQMVTAVDATAGSAELAALTCPVDRREVVRLSCRFAASNRYVSQGVRA